MVCCRTSGKCHYEPQRKPSGVRATSGWRQDVHASPQGSWGYEEESPSVVRLFVVQVNAVVNLQSRIQTPYIRPMCLRGQRIKRLETTQPSLKSLYVLKRNIVGILVECHPGYKK